MSNRNQELPSAPLDQTASPPRLELLFELEPADEPDGPGDAALLTALGHGLATALQQEGFVRLPPTYTGQKGMASLVIQAWLTLQQVAGAIWQQHTAIAEGLADIVALITIFEKLLPLLKRLRDLHARQVGRQTSQTRQINWTLELEGARLSLEATDLSQAEAAAQLARKVQAALASTTSPSGQPARRSDKKITIKGTVPPRPRRKRR